MEISCTACGYPYPNKGLPYRCQNCGGIYDFYFAPTFSPDQLDLTQPGIWRYRHAFGLSSDFMPISLGEGNTPLVWAGVDGRQIAFKCEFLNPSGSFKDRGSSVITSWLLSRGVSEAVEDSSGNAGASFAAYAARARIKARVFVPELASGPKCRQIEAYGAELVVVPGSREAVTEAVRVVANGGCTYASHAYLPFNLMGYSTTAYEIFEQLGNNMPGSIILPVGQGGLLLGLARGFTQIRIASDIIGIPRIVGVQARACAPLWALLSSRGRNKGTVTKARSLAEGVMVCNPLRREAVLQAVGASFGSIEAVEEHEILAGRDALAHLGFYVEPTSALVWSVLVKSIKTLPDPVVVVLTGSGLKYE